MRKIKSGYWFKEVRIPFKYRKVKDIVKSILKLVENDRDKGMSISQINFDYHIKYKYLILECLEKCFELKLITVPSFKKIGNHGYSDFYLVDIKSRLQSWYNKCLLDPEKAIGLVYLDFVSRINEFVGLYNTGICEMTYVFSLPQHIIDEVMKRINNDFAYRADIAHDYNPSSYNIDSLTYAITVTHCFDKAKEIDAKKGVNVIDEKSIKITQDQNFLLRRTEEEQKFYWNISNLINGLENAYNSDRNYIKEPKNVNKPTLINWVTNNLNFNEKEVELIKTLMRRKGFNISCEYDKNKQLNFKIESLNDKERRLKNIETMTTYTKMYGFGIEKIDFHSNDVQIMLEDIDHCNIINKETKWKDVQFKTVLSELSKEYGEYLEF